MCWTKIMCTRWRLLSCALLYLVFANTSGILTSNLTRHKACPNTDNFTLVLQDCADFQKSQSFLHCMSQCTSNQSCNGVVRDSSKTCYFYKPCAYLDFVDSCTKIPVRVYKKPDPCDVGAVFNASLGACVCKLGWTGSDCSTAPTSCNDLLTPKQYPVGYYWVDIKNADGTIATIFCEVIASGYRYHVFRNNGLVSHNKTYSDYVKGYKIDESNFWIGLDNIYRFSLSSNSPQLKMEAIFENEDVIASWTNTGVSIDSPSTFYNIDFWGSSNSASGSGYSVSITNCLSSGGTPFSTWDDDHDGSPSNLAAQAGAGWYFGSSLSCNPLGQLPSSGATAGYMALPNLDMVNGAYLSKFKYVMGYFY